MKSAPVSFIEKRQRRSNLCGTTLLAGMSRPLVSWDIGHEPAPSTVHFGELLRGDTSCRRLLPRTCRQLSEGGDGKTPVLICACSMKFTAW